jgi:hypothetical protein
MEHHVAIVSFEGAVKREAKRIREQLQADESLHEFAFRIQVSGRVHDGDLKLIYSVYDNNGGQYQEPKVTGDSVHAVMDEFTRRRGWTQRHAPKAIGYEKIPGDNTDPPPIPDWTVDPPEDEIPF